MKKIWKFDPITLGLIILTLIELITIIVLGCCGKITYREREYNNNVVDSLNKDNIIIVDSINFIDSIKNEYIEKNKNLSDSDAINLFYDLLKR